MGKKERGKNISRALFVCFTRMRALDINQSFLLQLFNPVIRQVLILSDMKILCQNRHSKNLFLVLT